MFIWNEKTTNQNKTENFEILEEVTISRKITGFNNDIFIGKSMDGGHSARIKIIYKNGKSSHDSFTLMSDDNKIYVIYDKKDSKLIKKEKEDIRNTYAPYVKYLSDNHNDAFYNSDKELELKNIISSVKNDDQWDNYSKNMNNIDIVYDGRS